MINPLQIPEIIGKVVEHLDTRDLAVVSFVNKTWRLEAQRKLYQNRRTIIYGFFKLEVCSESDQSGYPVIHPKFDRIRIDPVDDRMDHQISGQSDICNSGRTHNAGRNYEFGQH